MGVSFKNSMSSEVQLIADPENATKKRRNRSAGGTDVFRISFLLFYWLLALISFMTIISIWALEKADRPPPKVYPELPESCPLLPIASRCLYRKNFTFDLHALLRENETDLEQESEILWTKRNLTYGDLKSEHRFTTNVSIPEITRTNGSLYLHIYLTKSGTPPGPRKHLYISELYTIHKTKRLTFSVKKDGNDSLTDPIPSCWASNWTINLVGGGMYLSSWIDGPEKGLVDCDSVTDKFYPILYLNDKFNLARDCIPIEKTTQSLPLTLNFRQIELHKLRNYLGQKDFGDYLAALNVTEEDDLRQKLFESDFESDSDTKTDNLFFHSFVDVCLRMIFLGIFLGMIMAKSLLFKHETKLWLQLDRRPISQPLYDFINNLGISLFWTFFIFILYIILIIYWIVKSVIDLCKRCRSGDVDQEKNPKYNSKLLSKLGEGAFDSSLRLNHLMIFRNLVLFILLPLLALPLIASICHLTYSVKVNWMVFAIVLLFNCFCYLSSIYSKSGLFFFDLSPGIETTFTWMIALQFWAHFWLQMAVLAAVLYSFNLYFFSVPGLLIFLFSWLPSDVAAVLYLRELAIATHGKIFSVKFEAVYSTQDLLYPGSKPFYSPVSIKEEIRLN